MQIKTRIISGFPIIDLSGQLYRGSATKELRETFREMVKKDPGKIIINMQNVTHIDTPGLGELISCYAHAKIRGEQLVLLNPQEKLLNRLTLAKLRTVFDIFHDEALAVGDSGSEAMPA